MAEKQIEEQQAGEKKGEKRVRITLEMSSSFLRMLRTECTLSRLGNLHEEAPQRTAGQVLMLVTLLEGMGATEAQVHAETPLDWRNDLVPLSDRREVVGP
jgi:hypothetical protein